MQFGYGWWAGALWRTPDDHADPVSLAGLDEERRRAIEDVPPSPRPGWLVEQVARMRCPQLWEAVRTIWYRDASELSSVRSLLVDHVNFILMNQFRQDGGSVAATWNPAAGAVT